MCAYVERAAVSLHGLGRSAPASSESSARRQGTGTLFQMTGPSPALIALTNKVHFCSRELAPLMRPWPLQRSPALRAATRSKTWGSFIVPFP